MMQTGAERFFFFLFWKMFFCVVSDGKRKKEKHASSIGSSTGGPFFCFLFCCFFAEIADGVTRAACDEIPTWKARAGLLRWLLQHTVQRVCVKQPADETSVWKHRCRAKVNEPRHPLSTSAAAASSRVVPSINQQQHYVWDGGVITVNRRDERLRWLTGRAFVCGAVRFCSTERIPEKERVETVGTRSW